MKIRGKNQILNETNRDKIFKSIKKKKKVQIFMRRNYIYQMYENMNKIRYF